MTAACKVAAQAGEIGFRTAQGGRVPVDEVCNPHALGAGGQGRSTYPPLLAEQRPELLLRQPRLHGPGSLHLLEPPHHCKEPRCLGLAEYHVAAPRRKNSGNADPPSITSGEAGCNGLAL